MDWSNERYVRVYTRDTVEWLSWSWEARSLLVLLLRKVDRAGVLEFDGAPAAVAVAAVTLVPLPVVERALAALSRQPAHARDSGGPIELHEGHLLVRNFIEAQEAAATPAERKRRQRDRRNAVTRAERAGFLPEVTQRDAGEPTLPGPPLPAAPASSNSGPDPGGARDRSSRFVTESPESVTAGHDESPCTVPSRSDLYQAGAADIGDRDHDQRLPRTREDAAPRFPRFASSGVIQELDMHRLALAGQLKIKLPQWRGPAIIGGIDAALDELGAHGDFDGALEDLRAIITHEAELYAAHLAADGRKGIGIPEVYFRRLFHGDGFGAARARYEEARAKAKPAQRRTHEPPAEIDGQPLTDDERDAWREAGGGHGGRWAVQEHREKSKPTKKAKGGIWE